MKFGRLLKDATVGQPGVQNLADCYKAMKKLIKAWKKEQEDLESIASAEITPYGAGPRSKDSDSDCSEHSVSVSGRDANEKGGEGRSKEPVAIAKQSSQQARQAKSSTQAGKDASITTSTSSHRKLEQERLPEQHNGPQSRDTSFVEALSVHLARLNNFYLESEEAVLAEVETLVAECEEDLQVPEALKLLERVKAAYAKGCDALWWSISATKATTKLDKKMKKHVTCSMEMAGGGVDLLSQPFVFTANLTAGLQSLERMISQLSSRVKAAGGEAQARQERPPELRLAIGLREGNGGAAAPDWALPRLGHGEPLEAAEPCSTLSLGLGIGASARSLEGRMLPPRRALHACEEDFRLSIGMKRKLEPEEDPVAGAAAAEGSAGGSDPHPS
uniref:SPX domain-containing protein n=2 Tax=Tetraselmis sp. GSL018 TaxID=582737 RepID=A0A061QXZ0_9CHLO|eukprot:CAMPEP_0177612032 /NCGR_PEP_ID=MMETSP0419_2-20121207/20937_1 /TAXON_ID=582737 /ORGANISM="Tetraselmis sp., Strain GSL018" /LENGTH=388 /DNA_ID=CAMNT_0019108059 /DNA_START=338 /DNA_END=1504 /DNA_ORIENTATION=+